MGMNYWAKRFERAIPLVDAFWKKGFSKLVFTKIMNINGPRPQRRADNIVDKPYSCMTFRHMLKISIALEIPIGEVAELALKGMDTNLLNVTRSDFKKTIASALNYEERNKLNSKGRYHAKKNGPPPKSSGKWDYEVD